MSDLETLIAILKKQKKNDYVPPTRLAITLVNQILFLTHDTPRMRKMNSRSKDSNDGQEKGKCQLSYFSKMKNLTEGFSRFTFRLVSTLLLEKKNQNLR